MLNFSIGPVMSDKKVLDIAAEQTPYFRTQEFSELMIENEKIMLDLFGAPEDSRCVFLTSSGTGAMESMVMNILDEDDKVIVVNGGTFGHRFVELCELHSINYTEVKCEFGKQLKVEQLYGLEDHTAMLINMHETSSGLLYDMKMVSDFCRKNNIVLLVDAISSFLADELDMKNMGATAVITGSQKALACQPGISAMVLSPKAIERVESNKEICLYLSLKQALKDGMRGQTPFTPAISILLQLNYRLRELNSKGIDVEREQIKRNAYDFRHGISDLPFGIVPENPSNALTALYCSDENASQIVSILKEKYKIWVCPNGGEKAKTVFRVGHIGNIGKTDNDLLLDALHEIYEKDLLNWE